MSEAPAQPWGFEGTIVTDWADSRQLRKVVNDYRAVLLTIGGMILDRYERDGDYHFADTKFSVLTGKDFADSDPIRGRDAIYGWIQGRSLESMAGLDRWIARQDWLAPAIREGFHRRIVKLLGEVLDRMEEMRKAAGGRLFFIMDRQGRPLKVTADGGVAAQPVERGLPTSMTDLYYCIGKAAASSLLGRKDRLAQACREYLEICEDLRSGRFYLGQVPLDPRNSMVQPVQGKLFHLGRTIAIKGAGRFLECTGEAKYLDIGLEFIEHVLDRYVNCGEGVPPLRPTGVSPVETKPSRGQDALGTQGPEALATLSTGRYDMWEFTGVDGRPFLENGTLLGDPGTIMEFVGFCLKLARQARAMGMVNRGNAERIGRVEAIMPEILKRCFATSFSPGGMGLVRTLDLVTGKYLNDHVSWWGQMEALRSAVLAAELVGPGRRGEFENIAARLSNAYIGHFVRPDLFLMAYQTIDQKGQPADAIPATPDADVLYHTGLCLFDCLDVLDRKL